MIDYDELKRMVTRATDDTQTARDWSERDRDYYDGYQWTAEETAVMQKRKQPVITINRIKRKVDAMVGIEQRGRVDPRAYPRNPQDEQAADVATKALVFVGEKERIDQKRSSAFENLCVEGYGGVEIVAEDFGGQMEICVKRLRWEEIFFDPHSREKDFSDARFVGVLKWMSVDAAIEYARPFWQGDEDELIDLMDTKTGTGGETYDDRPASGAMQWVDKRLKRVRIAQTYYKHEGVWHLAIFTGRGELYNDRSPYLDERKQPTCAMILMSGYVDRENRRYGLVRDMISMQDEINKRRSKLLHALNNRQTMGTKGVVDVANMKRQLSMPDGHVEIDPAAHDPMLGTKPFEIIPTTDMTAGQFQLLLEAKQEIDNLGPNASLIGQLSGQHSGRAIMAQQQAGLAELAPIYDSLSDWTERVYRAVWNRIRQFWTEPRWIRVTDNNQAPQFLGINQMQMTPYGPQMMNAVAEIDVDIIIDQSPEYATLRAEQFEKLAEMASRGLPIPPKLIIQASDLQDKQEILKALDGDPQQAQVQQQFAMRSAVAEVETKEAKAERDRAAAAKDMASIPKARADAIKAGAEAVNTAQQTMMPPHLRAI